jgi:hypothetical protein
MMAGRHIFLVVRSLALASLVLGLFGCRVIKLREADDSAAVVNFRIENATGSDSDVTLSLSNRTAEDGSTDQTGVDSEAKLLAAQLITASDLPADVVVRVPAGSFSEGTLVCGDDLVISAMTGNNLSQPVVFTGDGAGTTGFDEGSVGAEGERRLSQGLHYGCSDAVIIRIEGDGGGLGASTGTGSVAVYPADDIPPVGFLPEVDGNGSGSGGGDDSSGDNSGESQDGSDVDTVMATIDNQTGSGIQVEYLVGTGDSDTDKRISVAVLPFSQANGTLDCARLITVTALILESDTGMVGAEPTLYQVTLFGVGTGTIGFDEPTIGPGNSRYLVLDEHFHCGETLLLTILDDASNINEELVDQPRIGLGSVEIRTNP